MNVSDIDQLITVITITDNNPLSQSRTVKRFSIGGRSLKGTVPHSDQPTTSAQTSEAQVESRHQVNVVSGGSKVRASAAFLGLAIVSGILIPEGSQATTASSVDVPTPQMHPTSDGGSNSQALEGQGAAATEAESSSEWQPSLLRTLSDLNQSNQHLEPNTADAVPSFKQSKPEVAEGSPQPEVPPALSSESFSPSTEPTQNSFQPNSRPTHFQGVEPTNTRAPLNLESDETAAEENSDRYTPHQAVYPRSGTNTPASITTSKVPGAVVIDSELSDQSVSVVYQVSSGETLAQIAQNHNISVGEIIAANDLADPNFIEVNQKLKIPQRSTAVRRSKFRSSQSADRKALGSPSARRSRKVIPSVIPSEVKAQAHKSLGSSLKPDRDQNRLSLDQLASIKTSGSVNHPTVVQPRAIEALSESDSALKAVSQSDAEMEFQLALAEKSDLQSESTSGLYTHRLRADVDRLRQEYQAQKALKLANASELTPDTDSEDGVTPTSNHQPLLLRRINPEFDPDAYRRQKAAAGEKADPPQPYAQEIEAIPVTESSTALSTPQQSVGETENSEPVVATAPLGSSAYDPLQNPALGKIVSPDLPPLPGPDTYLPGGSMRFNGHIWPSRGILTSGYGWRWGRMHRGIDIAAPIGTPIVASAPGVVIYAGWNSGGYGNLVEIEHPDGSVTLYAHNHRNLVNKGQKVAQGQQIAEMGSTGRSTGPHLHFEIHPSGNGAVNPMALLPRERDNVSQR